MNRESANRRGHAHAGAHHHGPREPGRPPGGRRRAPVQRRRNPLGALLAIVLAAALVAGLAYGVLRFTGLLGNDNDYRGDGSGSVTVVIPAGASGQEIAQVLADKDVVKTPDAFYAESIGDERSAGIQPGAYKLRKKMSADSALDALLDGENRLEARVVIPEGFRVGQVVDAIAAGSDIPKKELTDVLDSPEPLNLPEEANGNPEGYLYPATYVVEPGMTAVDILKLMVQKTLDVLAELNIDERAEAVNLDTEQVMTVASLLEYEANNPADFAKVARVVYNRLNEDIPLQFDSTVHYVSKRKGDVWTTPEERADPSEYNTYQHIGLPPGPIGSPGRATIEAALNPAEGEWLYFITDKKGVARYSTTYEEHVAKCRDIYGTKVKC